MIICGYPCIGKSTLARGNLKFIDLESSYFKTDGSHQQGWEVNYCKLAINLHKQSYIVFVSTHKEVIEYLKKSEVYPNNLFVLYPDENLYVGWVKKAVARFGSSRLYKDDLALQRIRDHYHEDIAALRDSGIPGIVICSMNYNLRVAIEMDLLLLGKRI